MRARLITLFLLLTTFLLGQLGINPLLAEYTLGGSILLLIALFFLFSFILLDRTDFQELWEGFQKGLYEATRPMRTLECLLKQFIKGK